MLKFNKGEFKLCAYGTLKPAKKNVKADEAAMIVSKNEDMRFYVQSSKKLVDTITSLVCRFALVATTTEPSEANMKLSSVSEDGWSIPMLANTRQVKSKDLLYVLEVKRDDASRRAAKKAKVN